MGLPSADSRPESGADREPDRNPSGRMGLVRGRSEQLIHHCARCRNRRDLCARLGSSMSLARSSKRAWPRLGYCGNWEAATACFSNGTRTLGAVGAVTSRGPAADANWRESGESVTGHRDFYFSRVRHTILRRQNRTEPQLARTKDGSRVYTKRDREFKMGISVGMAVSIQHGCTFASVVIVKGIPRGQLWFRSA